MDKVKIVAAATGANIAALTAGSFDVKNIVIAERTRRDPDSASGRKIAFQAAVFTSTDNKEYIVEVERTLGSVRLSDGSTLQSRFEGKEVILPSTGRVEMKPITGVTGKTANGRVWQLHEIHWSIKPEEIKVA